MSRHPFSVYERKGSPVWWFNFRAGGRRFRGPTQAIRGAQHKGQAEREAGALWLAECARQGGPAPAAAVYQLGTAEMIDQYVETDLAARAAKRGPKYASGIETDLLKHVEPRFPTVAQVTADGWDRARDEMHASGLSLRTIQRVTVSLRLFLRFCRRVGAIDHVPELAAPTGEEVAATQSERLPFTRAQRDRFLAEVKKLDARAHRIYVVLFYTLLRKGTVEKIRPRWIDWSTGYLSFPPGAIKSRKRYRAIYLHPRARAAIKAEVGAGALDKDEPVFGPFDLRKAFAAALVAAKIQPEGLTPHHATRHTGATIAGNDGASLAELMALGLWETPAMALRYMRIDAKNSKKAAGRL